VGFEDHFVNVVISNDNDLLTVNIHIDTNTVFLFKRNFLGVLVFCNFAGNFYL
jgi:hypothetical protein